MTNIRRVGRCLKSSFAIRKLLIVAILHINIPMDQFFFLLICSLCALVVRQATVAVS